MLHLNSLFVLLRGASRVGSSSPWFGSMEWMSIIVGVGIAIAFILLAVFISNAIKFEPGSNSNDATKRKIVFWVMGIAAAVVTLLLIMFGNYGIDIISSKSNKYNAGMYIAISTVVSFVVYVVIGLILSKMFKNSKIGNWF